jgi:pyrroline-5-carboxylate reductase
MKTKSLGFIGGGRITKIFLHALGIQENRSGSIVVCDTNKVVLEEIKKQFPSVQISDSCDMAAKQEIVLIALHPPVIMETLEKIKNSMDGKTIVISLAPKINFDRLAGILPTTNIIRMIPNATSIIHEGFNPLSFHPLFPENEKQPLLLWLKMLGHTFEVDEEKLEGYAIISAMLPTYFWFQWRDMVKLGLQMGLSEEESKESVHQTIIAASNLMFRSGLSYDEVIDLIPVKPISDHEPEITAIYHSKLPGLYQKIKP